MIGGSHFLQNASWLDPIGGLVISLMVIQAGWANTRSAILELADAGVDNEVKQKVQKHVLEALDGSDFASEGIEVRGVQGVKSGQNYLVDLELAVPSGWQLEKLQVVEKLVRTRIGDKIRGVRRVKIRFVPSKGSDSDFAGEFVNAHTGPTTNPEQEDASNGHGHNHSHDHEEAQPHAHLPTNGGISKRK